MSNSETTIKSLVQGFATHIRELKGPSYKESQVRLHYIDPFWELLGWDVDNRQQRPPQDVEVQVEPSMDSVDDEGLRSREPDYLFRANGFPRFVVEAKKPSVDLDTDKKAIFQAKRYAWNASIPFAVLFDFEQFRLYDATLKPRLNDPGRGLVKDFAIDFQDYPSTWEVLESTFGRDAVVGGSLEALLAQVKKVKAGRRVRSVDRMLIDLKGAEPVDRVFLDYLERFRQHFARSIYRDNKKNFPDADTLHGAARLTEAVQRLIDRLVFMRACEDRGVAEYGTLRAMLERVSNEGGSFYETLCREFRDLDREYNGYLFKYHFSESLNVSDDTLSDFVRTLYPPDGPWDFARIGDDILGIVYERFLGNTVTVHRGRAVVEAKPEVRHAGGVYYTPRFVVDTIIRRVVGPKVEGKAPKDIFDVKILDPACGSGSFLVAAFQFLMDHCLAAIEADPSLAKIPATPKARKKKKDIAFKDDRGRWHLAPDFRAKILTSCIHGVDIDQQAVEVTVMSLYLKMLEGELPPNWQKAWLENELLPPLDGNILCGNSLIDEASFDRYLEATSGTLYGEDEDTRFRINRFDWKSRTRGFGKVLAPSTRSASGDAGFDCIIGNPPYIRVQELNKWASEECAFYKWRYKSAAKGNYDIYVVFMERCLELLSPDGLLGFITPHKFWQATYGKGLRELLSAGGHLRSVIDFGDQQVFRGATTYTAIHILSRAQHGNEVDYAKIWELQDGQAQCGAIDANHDIETVERFAARSPSGEAPWVFTDREVSEWLDSVRGTHPRLVDVTQKIAQGIVTSADSVYFLLRKRDGYLSDETENIYNLENDIVHPVLKGSVHMKRWLPVEPERAVLFPYEEHEGRWRLIPEERLQGEYPNAWAYLCENRDKLEGRESGKLVGSPKWYGYVYPKNLDTMTIAKILVPAIASRAEYCIDPKGKYHYVGSGGGGGGGHAIVTKKVDLFYLCGILNSKCLEAFLHRVTTPFHSGWYAYSKAYIAQIPIKIPETSEEKKRAERIADSVRAIMDAKEKLRSRKLSDRERASLESAVEADEHRINEATYALYGVSEPPTR